jgi:L-glyceraldehyde 3-phosphate reductase
MGLEYVDVFYSHRFDPNTPLEETMGALASAVHAGKALYVGVSNYDAEQTERAAEILKDMGVPLTIHQPRYSMFDRTPEHGLFTTLEQLSVGAIVFSPLAQGLLTDRYFAGIPADSRAARAHFLTENRITEEYLGIAKQLYALAKDRGQSLSQMALAWALRHQIVASALVGASSATQLENNLAALQNKTFSPAELELIEPLAKHGLG